MALAGGCRLGLPWWGGPAVVRCMQYLLQFCTAGVEGVEARGAGVILSQLASLWCQQCGPA
jgi:hypothetical protein